MDDKTIIKNFTPFLWPRWQEFRRWGAEEGVKLAAGANFAGFIALANNDVILMGKMQNHAAVRANDVYLNNGIMIIYDKCCSTLVAEAK